MNARYLRLVCVCGRKAKRISLVGFTSLMELYVQWRCDYCKRHCYILKPFEECVADCPTLAVRSDFSIRDIAELHSMGVCLPAEAK